MNQLSTPILFIVFNRPESTQKVFGAIRKARPVKLFISADGPRTDKTREKEKCEEVRKITEKIDWPCEVMRNYSETNQGCKSGVSNAITWFFNNVESGIILEDDCLPDLSFFFYCEELLERYKNSDKIKMISGVNFQQEKIRGDGSYYFSKLPQIWGWATWKRAWKDFDLTMPNLNTNKNIPTFWLSHFKHIRDKNIDTWDAQWAYAVMKSSGLSITPNINLVKNIGFNKDATHTHSAPAYLIQETQSMTTLIHPSTINADSEADKLLMKLMYKRSFAKKAVSFLKRFLANSK